MLATLWSSFSATMGLAPILLNAKMVIELPFSKNVISSVRGHKGTGRPMTENLTT